MQLTTLCQFNQSIIVHTDIINTSVTTHLVTDTKTGLVLNVEPLLQLIRLTAQQHEVPADPRVLTYVLAAIAKGCNCDRDHEVQFMAEANTLLWELNRLVQDMVVPML